MVEKKEGNKVVDAAKEDFDSVKTDAQGFFSKHKGWVIAAGVVVVVIIIFALVI